MQGLEHGPTHEATNTSLPNKCNRNKKTGSPVCWVCLERSTSTPRCPGGAPLSGVGNGKRDSQPSDSQILACVPPVVRGGKLVVVGWLVGWLVVVWFLRVIGTHCSSSKMFFSKQNLVFLNYVCYIEVQDASRRGTQPLVLQSTKNTYFQKLLQLGLKGA